MKMKFITLLLVFIPIFVFISFVAYDSNFFTTPQAFAAHARINLATSDNFAILAGSAISDTGTSAVTGFVGLSPTGGTAITGLTCAEVTGTIYDTNGGYTGGGAASTACLQTNADLLTTAKNDLTQAYNEAAGRTTTSTVATELGGTTLTDGTYDSSAGTFGITGTVTLDGQGNPNAVFIFKMASTLITASSSRVLLTNSAQACNVYWQVGSSATLGTNTTFIGNILALTSITDNGSSTVNGRLLARNGAVTLNNTTVTRQTCATPTPTSSSSSTTSSGGSSSTLDAKVCPALGYIAPIIIESRRVDADSIFISWGPYSGVNTFVVQYGFENGNWLFSTNVTGFSTTINGLPANLPIWVRIAATDNCSAGTYGEPKLVGGTASTNSPGFPNTGIGPQTQNIPIRILETLLLIFVIFYLVRIAYNFNRNDENY